MVLLAVENEESLKNWIDFFKKNHIIYNEFIEPDMNDQITAIAVCPSVDSKIFKDLKLLKV